MTPRDTTAVFAPQYFGSVRYYAALWRCRRAFIDTGLRYDKRFKSIHRCEIADTHGQLALTVPVARPQAGEPRLWSAARVSAHGQWWHNHIVSLESAYGRTPYFEFYIDRFKPWLCDTGLTVTNMCRGIDETLRCTLGIDTEVRYATPQPGEYAIDLRNNRFEDIRDVEYYQVRADRFGFIPGLSVLDLLFNMGPESVLILDRMSPTAMQ